MVTMIKGGPHGQQGPAFNAKAQVYAAHGYAVLMVNYRGSTGYGQPFADAIFKDQNGGEEKDVLAGVDAAIANLVSFNYMSYYHDYLAVEFGMFPHEAWRPGAPRTHPAGARGGRIGP